MRHSLWPQGVAVSPWQTGVYASDKPIPSGLPTIPVSSRSPDSQKPDRASRILDVWQRCVRLVSSAQLKSISRVHTNRISSRYTGNGSLGCMKQVERRSLCVSSFRLPVCMTPPLSHSGGEKPDSSAHLPSALPPSPVTFLRRSRDPIWAVA